MNLRVLCRNSSKRSEPYATSEDFRRLFLEDKSSLHLLSFLLTADLDKAEKCFVSGLEDCLDRNSVFAEWAGTWARRTIVQNAIRMMAPVKNDAGQTSPSASLHVVGKHAQSVENDTPFAGVLSLAKFDRFVFVISVLERYPDQECARLLGTSISEVRQTRERAVLQVAEFSRNKDQSATRTEGLAAGYRAFAATGSR
jgi:hypothetical protein